MLAFTRHRLLELDARGGPLQVEALGDFLLRLRDGVDDLGHGDLGTDVEAVIGLGPNLFYNSPMEACVVVCNRRKPAARKGKVLFIDIRTRAEAMYVGLASPVDHLVPFLEFPEIWEWSDEKSEYIQLSNTHFVQDVEKRLAKAGLDKNDAVILICRSGIRSDEAARKLVQAGFETLPEPLPGACEWELWHYSPAIVPDSDTVDPLSLTLSLQGNQDERVQLALDELKGRFPW